MTAEYTVKGMTCDHCVRAVTTEVTKLPAVTGVEIDLGSGHLSVTSDGAVDQNEVRAAVEEAGYELS
jgi:copper chaperone CopZ